MLEDHEQFVEVMTWRAKKFRKKYLKKIAGRVQSQINRLIELQRVFERYERTMDIEINNLNGENSEEDVLLREIYNYRRPDLVEIENIINEHKSRFEYQLQRMQDELSAGGKRG
jgi:hypothetical protein